LIEYLS